MVKGKPLGFRLEPQTKDALVEAARSRRRSVSNLTELILTEWLTDRGLLPTSSNTRLVSVTAKSPLETRGSDELRGTNPDANTQAQALRTNPKGHFA
jgi:hypothetical protein